MADKEFEEFRQFFEQLPQHIKAPSNCYTDGVVEEVIVAQTVQEVGQEAQPRGKESGAIPSSGPLAWSTSLQSRYAPDDIFNAGKISFYYNYLPESCRAFRSSVKHGKDKTKGRRESGGDKDEASVKENKPSADVWKRDSNRLAVDRNDHPGRQRRRSNPEIRESFNWKQRETDAPYTRREKLMRIHGRDVRVMEGDDESLVRRMKTKLEEKITSATKSIHKRAENHRVKKGVMTEAHRTKPKETKLDKNPKKIVTVLFISNMTGSEKLPILVTGRTNLKKTRKSVKTLPTAYMYSKEASKSSITQEIFTTWVKQQDDRFFRSKRKIAFILDSMMQQLLPPATHLKSMEVINLPGHIAYKSHPIEGKLSHEIRTQYKLILLDTWFRSSKDIADFQVSILDAMYILRRVWAAVEPSSIRRSFKACGMSPEGDVFPKQIAADLLNKISTEDFVGQCGIALKAFEEWVSVEDEINTRTYSTEEEILANIEKEIITDGTRRTRHDKDDGHDTHSIQTAATQPNKALKEIVTTEESKIQNFDTTTHRKKPRTSEKGKGDLYSDDETSDGDEEAVSAFLPPNGRQMRAACSALQAFIMACPEADEMLAHLALIENFCVSQDITSRIKKTAQTEAKSPREMPTEAKSPREMPAKAKSPMESIEKLL
ncbi:major centromere autoantigen B isoform X2 [Macrobrachium rosenbergii]|uniref:major centromere autoantigen B isoform X2 n=1 Tax=Macrobrachium rosenbergii TaxID=79674 RepID=UPI0034D67D5E